LYAITIHYFIITTYRQKKEKERPLLNWRIKSKHPILQELQKTYHYKKKGDKSGMNAG
jgi:hypothetical protein